MSSRSDASARLRPGRGARSPRRVLAAALTALFLVGAGAGPSGATVGSAAQPTAPTVQLVSQPTWVRPGEPFDVQVRLTGAPEGAALNMVVHDRLESRSAFRRTLEGELGGSEYRVPSRPVAELPAGPAGSVVVGFTPGTAGARLSGRGVYPVEVRLLSPDGDVGASLVTYLPFLTTATPDFPPLAVATLVDVAGPPSLQPDGNVVLPADTLARARERVQVLRATPGVPLTLATRPETLEGLAADPAGAGLVEQLAEQAAERPVFARPFVDVDLAALQRAGLISEANAQADGGADVVRTRFGVEPTGGMWLSGPTLGAEAARLAVRLGIDRAVVPPSAVGDGEPSTPPAAPVRLGEGGPLAMVGDAALAAHLTSDDGMVAAHRFIAELAITWLEAPSIRRGVVVHLPAGAQIDPEVVAVALGALADGEAVEAVPIDEVFRDVPQLEDGPTTVEVAPHDVSDDLRAVAPALESVRARVAGVGALLDDAALTTSLERSLLLSTGTDTPDADRPAYVARADAALGTVSGAVTLPDEFRITLTSRSSSIPVTLTNLSEQDLSVRVELDSDQLEFPDGDVLTSVLAPGTTRLEVPVRARTSGAFTLDVTVTSPDGSIVLDTSTFDVRSTAISGVGIVLSIGAVLFLAIWWARHWHSARRSRHLVPASAASASGPGAQEAQVPRAAAATDSHYRPAHMARQRTRSG
jgi:Family of unknown function (DUF6049)